MAVAGAFIVFSTFPSLRDGLSRSLLSGDFTKITRIGRASHTVFVRASSKISFVSVMYPPRSGSGLRVEHVAALGSDGAKAHGRVHGLGRVRGVGYDDHRPRPSRARVGNAVMDQCRRDPPVTKPGLHEDILHLAH